MGAAAPLYFVSAGADDSSDGAAASSGSDYSADSSSAVVDYEVGVGTG